MSQHHHHHHPLGHAHPPAAIAPSILRLSVFERLVVVSALIAAIWAAVSGRCIDERALQFRDLTLGYDRHPAVHHLSGEVTAGALFAVVGPNGAGKSTLFKGIVGAIKPLSGHVDLSGLSARDIAYLPQAAEIDRSFPITVYDLVAMGLWRKTGLFGGIGKKDRDRIETALAAVGLTGFERRAIGTFSGGKCSACCSRGCCCRTRASSFSTSRSTQSTPRLRRI